MNPLPYKTTLVKSERAHDAYYEIDHPSGLKIFVYPKENSHSAYAVFGTKYGSVDTCFRRSDESQPHQVPEGIAHFLEHKLFESEEGDAFSRYAKTGASANAYTSFDMTCYLFSCTENFSESLEILLDFVQSPYFTEQTVKKEQGIIGQEIRMYDDDPHWRVMFNLLSALYHNHPVKIDIAGTVESIAQITPEYLYQCYHTFYNLHNMVLCVAGKVKVEEVCQLADRMLKPAPAIQVERIFQEEPREIVKERVEQRLAVTVPLFQFGFKEPACQTRTSMKDLACMEILLDVMASDCSPLFRRLLDAELINESSFSYDYFEGPGYASVIFSGESKNPQEVAKQIRQEVSRLRKTGIDPVAFERSKRALYGRNISVLNSGENIANAMVAMYFSGRELFSYIDTLAQITLAQVEQYLAEHLQENQTALSVVLPLESEQGGQA